MASIESLHLTNFRNYEGANLAGLSPGPVVLTGPNGAGKTNVLEAISLFSPGRGLRGVKIQDMQKHDSDMAQPWAVAATVQTHYGPMRLGTGSDETGGKRLVRINGEAVKAQAALAEYLACVWLTPQMDRLFLDTPSARRKFLDRLIYAFDSGHASRVTRYETAMGQRARILREEVRPDPVWLDGLESVMAESGVAVSAARLSFVEKLQIACDHEKAPEHEHFPRVLIRADGTIEHLLARVPALEAEDMFRYQLRASRADDARTGGAATGPHKGDMKVWYAEKNMVADQCSTGEQKALLFGIVLAHSRLVAMECAAPPILLLDEVSAHLDDRRRAALYDLLLAWGGQVWMTGTDLTLFHPLNRRAQYIHVEGGCLRPRPQEQAA